VRRKCMGISDTTGPDGGTTADVEAGPGGREAGQAGVRACVRACVR
jgi:hypothetical protein